jgi:hypothetical protein
VISLSHYAFGRVNALQRQRIRAVRAIEKDRPIIAVLHHHFGRLGASVPGKNLFGTLLNRGMDRALAMADTIPLIEAFGAGRLTLAFCGHSHFSCNGHVKDCLIVCAPANSIGNENAAAVAEGRNRSFSTFAVTWNTDGCCSVLQENWHGFL